jgi:hypothetical protein
MSYILCLWSYGQKEDYNWLIGSGIFNKITFNESSFQLDTFESIQYLNIFITNAIITNEQNEIVLFTGGADIFNNLGNVIENGDSINPGWIRNSAGLLGSYSAKNGALFLRSLKTENNYFLFHLRGDTIQELDSTSSNGFGTNIFYTQIERNSLNEFYVEKKIYL